VIKMDLWTPDEIRKLEDKFPITSNEELSQILNKSELSIISKAQRMNLKKDWKYKQYVLKKAKMI
jgi:hypothetical protein